MAGTRLQQDAAATAKTWNRGNIAGLDDAMTRRLVASTVMTESNGGNLTVTNAQGYVGRYQAGAGWLAEAGLVDAKKLHDTMVRDGYDPAKIKGAEWKWAVSGGMTRFLSNNTNWEHGLSLAKYKGSAELQDTAFKTVSDKTYNQALKDKVLGPDDSMGKVAGFMKARHISGYGGAVSLISSGRQVADANGTSNYKYFHDVSRNKDGLDAFVPGSAESRTKRTGTAHLDKGVPGPSGGANEVQPSAKSFDQAMKVMLPDAAGKSVHITGQYGTDRGDHKHGGVDFNYQGGQTGINMKHPQVHSPVSGKVEYCTGGSFGTVKIRDGQGHLHEILHLQSRANLQVGQAIHAGDVIGTMGGRGPKDANQYAQHVHYQIRDKNGKLVNPEAFWNGRSVEQAPPGANAPAKVQDAMADGTLRHGENGPAVAHVQQMLAAVGYAGADGKPLPSTGNYLDNTQHAVRQFQRAHGLSETGVADRQTIDALKAAAREPLLTNDKHPDNPLYEQVKAKCDAQGGAQKLGLGSEREYKQALASIAFEAKVAGMAHVDHVVPSTNGRTLIAMQVNPATGDQLRAVVDKQQAMQQPVEQSSYQLRQAEQQLQSQQKAQTQQQQTQQQNAPVQAR